jgi:hypothetical protein
LQLVTERSVLQRPSIKVAADRENQRESWFATHAFEQYAHEGIAFGADPSIFCLCVTQLVLCVLTAFERQIPCLGVEFFPLVNNQ